MMQDPAKKTYLMNRVEKTKEEEQLDSVVAEALSVLENKLMKVKKEKATLTAQIGKANLNPELKALLQKRLFKQSKKETKINNQMKEVRNANMKDVQNLRIDVEDSNFSATSRNTSPWGGERNRSNTNTMNGNGNGVNMSGNGNMNANMNGNLNTNMNGIANNGMNGVNAMNNMGQMNNIDMNPLNMAGAMMQNMLISQNMLMNNMFGNSFGIQHPNMQNGNMQNGNMQTGNNFQNSMYVNPMDNPMQNLNQQNLYQQQIKV